MDSRPSATSGVLPFLPWLIVKRFLSMTPVVSVRLAFMAALFRPDTALRLETLA
jgi:hypothetical protein